MNQKGFISLLLAVVITALLVGGSTYYYQQTRIKQQTEKALLKINSLEKEIRHLETELDLKKTDITDWLTYESRSYSFKYPSHYVFEKNITGGPHVIEDALFRDEQEKKIVMLITRIFPDEPPDGEPDEELIKTEWRPDYYGSVKATGERTIGGQKAYMFIQHGNLLFKFADENFSRSRGGISIKFHNVSSLNDELNQILDSFTFDFKLPEQVLRNNIYTNENFSFQLTFPDSWQGYVFQEHSKAVNFGFAQQENLFTISVMTKKEWQDYQTQIPRPAQYIAENDQYVFVYSQGHDVHNDLLTQARAIPNIITTFKFLDITEN